MLSSSLYHDRLLEGLNFFAGDASIVAEAGKQFETLAAAKLSAKAWLEYGVRLNEKTAKHDEVNIPTRQSHSSALVPVSATQAGPVPSTSFVSTKDLTSVIPYTPGRVDVPATAKNLYDHLVIRPRGRKKPQLQHPEWELKRVIAGHRGWVRCLAVDPSNEWFASGANDRLIKIWDLARGTLKLTLTGHINNIRALEISRRSPYLFSAGEDHMVKCWDLEYNKVTRSYNGHSSGVYALALHPSLDVMATGGRDCEIKLWDIRTRAAIYTLVGHSNSVMSLVAQRPEPQLISGSSDKMIRTWDLRTGQTATVLTHHSKGIRELALHPHEYTFCSAAGDNVKVWKCPNGRFERDFEPVHEIVNCVTIKEVSVGAAVAIGGTDTGQLHFWDWESGIRFQSIDVVPAAGSLSSEKSIFACALDMSHTRLITGECDKTIKVWVEKADG